MHYRAALISRQLNPTANGFLGFLHFVSFFVYSFYFYYYYYLILIQYIPFILFLVYNVVTSSNFMKVLINKLSKKILILCFILLSMVSWIFIISFVCLFRIQSCPDAEMDAKNSQVRKVDISLCF